MHDECIKSFIKFHKDTYKADAECPLCRKKINEALIVVNEFKGLNELKSSLRGEKFKNAQDNLIGDDEIGELFGHVPDN